MQGQAVVDITRLIEGRGYGRYQFWIFVVCFAVAMTDGYDSQSIGLTAPLIMKDLHLNAGTIGLVFSASQWGYVLGALVFGPLCDRFGRRNMLAAAAFILGLSTFVTPWAHSAQSLTFCRLVTGVGVGGAFPCFCILATEFAARRIRARIMVLLLGAVPAGGMIAALLTSYLLPHLGWHSIFYIGGMAPILLSLLVLVNLPESLGFLVARGAPAERVRKIAMRVAPGVAGPDVTRFIMTEETKKSGALKDLFTAGRGLTTILLWTGCFVYFFIFIVIALWTSNLLVQTGMTIAQASIVLAFQRVGTMVNCVIIGPLMEKFGHFNILALWFVIATISVAGMGLAAPSYVPVEVFSALAGVTAAGGGMALNSICPLFYPTLLRSTATGWMMGVGRIGGAVSPVIVGAMVGWGLQPSMVFLVVGLTALINVVALLLLRARAPIPTYARAAAGVSVMP